MERIKILLDWRKSLSPHTSGNVVSFVEPGAGRRFTQSGDAQASLCFDQKR